MFYLGGHCWVHASIMMFVVSVLHLMRFIGFWDPPSPIENGYRYQRITVVAVLSLGTRAFITVMRCCGLLRLYNTGASRLSSGDITIPQVPHF
jgi:hypothetical protein